VRSSQTNAADGGSVLPADEAGKRTVQNIVGCAGKGVVFEARKPSKSASSIRDSQDDLGRSRRYGAISLFRPTPHQSCQRSAASEWPWRERACNRPSVFRAVYLFRMERKH